MLDSNISAAARIGYNNTFGRGVVITDNVSIGDDNVVDDYTIITGATQIGSGNYIGRNVLVGSMPIHSQSKHELSHDGQQSVLSPGILIGDRNVIREYTNLCGPVSSVTRVGNDCYIMTHCEIAHDVQLEDGVIISNHSGMGGYVRILQGANLGKGVQVHQRTVIGQFTMLGMGAVVIRNILPAAKVAGNPARLLGVNDVGLQRATFTPDEIKQFGNVINLGRTRGPLDLSPRVKDIMCRFLELLPAARDARTVPGIDLAALAQAVQSPQESLARA